MSFVENLATLSTLSEYSVAALNAFEAKIGKTLPAWEGEVSDPFASDISLLADIKMLEIKNKTLGPRLKASVAAKR